MSILLDGEGERARQAALRLLASRPRSCEEVRRRLAIRFPTGAVEQAVVRLREQGYLDDAAFARFWRERREAHRPCSAAVLRRELVDRGVAREVAEAALAGLDEEENAYRAGRHRLRALQGVDESTFRRRLVGYLQRRGFGLGLAHKTVERLWRQRGAL